MYQKIENPTVNHFIYKKSGKVYLEHFSELNFQHVAFNILEG